MSIGKTLNLCVDFSLTLISMLKVIVLLIDNIIMSLRKLLIRILCSKFSVFYR